MIASALSQASISEAATFRTVRSVKIGLVGWLVFCCESEQDRLVSLYSLSVVR
jgi:hypothetical protein